MTTEEKSRSIIEQLNIVLVQNNVKADIDEFDCIVLHDLSTLAVIPLAINIESGRFQEDYITNDNK